MVSSDGLAVLSISLAVVVKMMVMLCSSTTPLASATRNSTRKEL